MSRFNLNITAPVASDNRTDKVIDWNALNDHVIEVAKTAKAARSIPGVIVGFADLGEQNQEHGAEAFTGTPEEEAEILAKQLEDGVEPSKRVYFEDGIDPQTKKAARMRRYPRKPAQQVAAFVDFPQAMVDKGQFFGNSKPLPLRLPLNGEFSVRGADGKMVKIVGKPFTLKEINHAEKGEKPMWAFAKNSMLHKLADATGLLDDNGLFKKERVGELIGKVAQFKIRVYMKPGKGDAKFFTEEISLAGMVPEGVPVPEVDESMLFLTQVNGENDPEAVKQLRVSTKNTIKRANNYEGSAIQALFEASGDKPAESAVKQAVKAAEKAAVEPVTDFDNFDDDLPF